jgi:F-type H+-transporting ATPase subunit b
MLLDIDLVTILAEILNFLALAAALYFLLFKPMMKRIDKRSEEKERNLREAREKEMEAEEKLNTIEERLSNLNSEIESRLDEAFQKAQSERQSLLEATQEEAEKILSDAENEAAKRQQQEMEELQERLVDTILDISSQILVKTTPNEVHENLIKDLTAEIWDMGKNDMRQVRTIRDSLSERTPTVHVTSGKELTADQQRSLVKTFSALADSNVNMEIEVEPSLISGIRVRIGDLVVENTLAMELNELRNEVVKSLEESINVEE